MRLTKQRLDPCPCVSVRLTLARGPRPPGLPLPWRQGLWSLRSALTGPWDSVVFAQKCMSGSLCFGCCSLRSPGCRCSRSGFSSCRTGSAFRAVGLVCNPWLSGI